MRAKPPERPISSTSAAASGAIGVLVADSHKMQSQLLVSALRRRPEFQVISCPMDMDLVLNTIAASEIKVALMITDHHNSGLQDMATVRRVHLAYPEIAKVLLVESSIVKSWSTLSAPVLEGFSASQSCLFARSASAYIASPAGKFGPTPNN